MTASAFLYAFDNPPEGSRSTALFPVRARFSFFGPRLFHECGVVKKLYCDVSAPRGTLFKLSPAPLPPSKLAIAHELGDLT
jgi:hypothetical protein